MAKLLNGIMGKASGKIGNVVTGSWKGINYARSYVKPANPNTTAQQNVRESFSTIVFIARAIILSHIREYWDTLVKGKSTSGFAKFVGVNQKLISGTTDYQNIKLATGSLEGLNTLVVEVTQSAGGARITWDEVVATSGALTDSVLIRVYDAERNFVYSQDASYTRDDELGVATIAGVEAGETYYVYVDVYNSDGDWATTVGSRILATT